MEKRALSLVVSLAAIVFGSLILFCTNMFDSPTAPEKTEISAVFQGAGGKIYDGYFFVDSVGHEIGIGAALYLPANFDAIIFKVVDSGGTVVIDSTIREFNDEYFRDTVWIRYTFWSPGVKKVTITPFVTPGRSPIVSEITIAGSAQNTAPQWSVDTLRRTVKVGEQLTQKLAEICTDTERDVITYTLITGSPENDTVVGTTYQFSPTQQNIGTHVVQIKASDSKNRFSILPVKITVADGSGDTSHYTVVYDGNGNTGGSVPVDPNDYAASSTVTIKDNTGLLVKTGAAFAGWNRKADGSGTSYAAGATFSMGSSDVTLYARWSQPSPFTVTYNGNSHTAGAAPVDTGKYETGAAVTVKGNTGNMVKVGYTFTGWNTAADGSGTAYAAGVTFLMGSANSTLFAQWTTGPTFTLTYNGNGSTGGTVPSDVNNYRTAAIVTVKENTGLLVKTGATFAGWNTAADGSGIAISAGSLFTIENADVVLYARWTQNATFSVTYNGNANTSGAVPVDPGKYESGATVIVKNNTGNLVRAGFTFVGWATSASGTEVYKGEETFKIGTGDVTLYAIWKQNTTFTLTITATNGQVTLSPNATVFDSGTIVKLTPVPSSNYHFAGWSGALTGTANPATIIMSSAKSVIANFEANPPNTFALTVLAPHGTVQKTPDQTQYDSGSVVALTAVPDAGYQFTGWSGAITGTTNPSSVTMNAAKSVTATFAIKTYTLSVTAANGSVTKSPEANSHDSGTVVTLTAIPDAGYQFTGWSGAITGTTNPSSVTMNAAKSVTANFAIKTYALSVTVANGSVTKSPEANSYDSGTVVTLTAVPDAGYQFTGWSGALTGTTNPFFVTMNAAKSVTANFALNTYQLTVIAGTGGVISAPGGPFPKTVNSGEAIILTASASSGHRFVNWTITPSTAGSIINATSANSATVTLTSGNATVQANFMLELYQLIVTSTVGGTISKPDFSQSSVASGNSVAIQVDFNTSDYNFVNWTITSGTAEFVDASLPSTYVIPSSNATVRANLSPVLKVTLSPEWQTTSWGQMAQTITSTVTGGTPPYTYCVKTRGGTDCSNYESSFIPYFWPAGTYEYYMEVTDAKGAIATSNFSTLVITEAVTE